MQITDAKLSAVSVGVLAAAFLLNVSLRAAEPARYQQAEAAIQSGAFDEALGIAVKLLADHPGDVKALVLKGLALTGRHELPTADEAFEQALRTEPSLALARKSLAVNQLALKRPIPAEKNFAILLRQTPGDPVIHMYLGEIAFRRKDYRAASSHFVAVKNDWVADARLPVMMAECDYQLGKPREGAALLQSVDVGRLNVIWQFHAGSLLAGHQEFAAATPFFEAALAGYPQPDDVKFNLGLCYTETKNFKQAIDVLSELREQGIKTAEIDNLLAEAYEGNKQSKEAIDLLREATSIAPTEEKNYIDLAMLCADHNSFDLALEVVQVGLHNLPNSDGLLVQQAMIYAMTGRYEESEKDFLAASHSDSVRGPALAGLGLTYIQKGDLGQAVSVLRQRAKQDPDNAAILYLLGEALMRTGIDPNDREFVEAVGALEKAIRLNPRFVHSRVVLAKLYLRENKNADGIRELREAIKLDPTKVQAFAVLAAALKKEGKADEAAPMFAKVRELNDLSRSRERPTALYKADDVAGSPK